MKQFIIKREVSWYTSPISDIDRFKVFFLEKGVEIDAYYHDDYHGGDPSLRNKAGTVENIITTLKNQFRDKTKKKLEITADYLFDILKKDLQVIPGLRRINKTVVCVIPRAKPEQFYDADQLYFKKTIKEVIETIPYFIDGTDYITRYKKTRTTHLDRSGYGGEGPLPYPGITKDTCRISPKVEGKKILLIDDLYTNTVNIDEDAIQALFDKGSSSVIFYSIGKTIRR